MHDLYIAAISGAMLHRRTALHIELAVGICIAYDFVDDEVPARVALTNIYAASGYDCLTRAGLDYKTINRRVNVAMQLFDHLGGKRMKIGAVAGMRRIEHVQRIVEALTVQSINDVLLLIGRPVSSTPAPAARMPVPRTEQARRAVDAPGVQHVRTEHLDLAVPPGTTRSEVLQLAAELLKLAETLNGPVKRGRGRQRLVAAA
jgi:hypothetical protein